MEQRQLVIVGGGPAGYEAAAKAADLGIQTTLVERDEVGGTCLNRGCIPTKTILHTAELFAELGCAEGIGLHIEKASVDYAGLRSRKNAVIDQLRAGVEELLESKGVELVRGTATINDIGSIVAPTADGAVREFSADYLIIAAGTSPALPPIAGIDLAGVHTSDTILEAVPKLDRLAVIGGGVIGMEFASAYTALGTQVSVLESANRILPTMDREFGQSLTMVMKKRGCSIATGAHVGGIEQHGNGLLVRYTLKDKPLVVEADAVLVATGRTPRLRELFGTRFAPALEHGRIAVDEHMRTSISRVYAIGDAANAGLQLAHAASAQGIVAVSDIAGASCNLDVNTIPSCVYTSPEIASVGLTEAAAKEADIEILVGKAPMGGNAKTVIGGEDRSFMKVLATPEGTIVGAHLMCGRATDMIGELAVAVANGLTVDQMARAVRPHPTFEEALGVALEALSEKLKRASRP